MMLALRDLQSLLRELEETAPISQLRQLVDQRQILHVLGVATKRLFALMNGHVGAMLVNRDLDRAAKLDFLEWLENVAERSCRAPPAATCRGSLWPVRKMTGTCERSWIRRAAWMPSMSPRRLTSMTTSSGCAARPWKRPARPRSRRRRSDSRAASGSPAGRERRCLHLRRREWTPAWLSPDASLSPATCGSRGAIGRSLRGCGLINLSPPRRPTTSSLNCHLRTIACLTREHG